MKTSFFAVLAVMALAGCSKAIDAVQERIENGSGASNSTAPSGTQYIIESGAHYCNQNGIRAVDVSEQKFSVRFDSSAIYATANPGNQADINKLWGFSDNNNFDHHQYSARFGWRWSGGALRLFGYVYNAGTMTEKELGTIAIGAEHDCSIRVAPGKYYFTLNGRTDSMTRTATTPTGKGYQLYPYFGGDEAAPHQVRIWIKE